MGLAVMTVMSALVVAYLATAVESSNWTEEETTKRRLENAAESLIALSVDEIWGGFQRDFPSQASHWDFRIYLDSVGITDQAAAMSARHDAFLERRASRQAADAAAAGGGYDGEGSVATEGFAGDLGAGGLEGGLKSAASLQLNPHRMHEVLGLPTNRQRSRNSDVLASFVGVDVEGIDVIREDGPNSIRLTFEATVSMGTADVGIGGDRATVREVYVIRPAQWEGLDFALLANNINCVMCHTSVDDANRFYNADAALYGTFDRVKLGSMESFQLREDPHSSIAGTLYLNGKGLTADGHAIEDWGSLNLKSREFDEEGMLVEDDWGDLNETNLSPADEIDPDTFENLYVEYQGDRRVDGYMPDTFPSPFPDDGGYDPAIGGAVYEHAGNRVLDDSEFYAAAASSSGTVSGGTIGVLPIGGTVTTEAELATFMAGGAGGLDSVTGGNVVLYGTDEDPIILNGDIAIDGDLIIHGVVKGLGSLKVSGNIYVASDILYKDGKNIAESRTFGVAGDGSKNLLAMAAGGNIMVGNVFHPAFGEGETTGGSDGSFNFIMDELALFNRMEWMKTQPELPGERVHVKVGEEIVPKKKWDYESYWKDVTVKVWEYYWVDEEVPVYEWENNGLEGEYFKEWKVQTGTVTKSVRKRRQIGTKVVQKKKWRKVGDPYWVDEVQDIMEWQSPTHANSHYMGEDYVPRYYGFTEGSTIPIFNKDGHYDPDLELWVSDERAKDWDSGKLTYADPNDSSDSILFDAAGNPKAVLSTLTGTGGWITDNLLESFLEDTLAQRDAEVPLEVNAMLYSNNSIFGIIPAHFAEGLAGEMILNGGMVAADIGLLAPSGFQLNYDNRGKEVLDIQSDSELGISKLLSIPRERID